MIRGLSLRYTRALQCSVLTLFFLVLVVSSLSSSSSSALRASRAPPRLHGHESSSISMSATRVPGLAVVPGSPRSRCLFYGTLQPPECLWHRAITIHYYYGPRYRRDPYFSTCVVTGENSQWPFPHLTSRCPHPERTKRGSTVLPPHPPPFVLAMGLTLNPASGCRLA